MFNTVQLTEKTRGTTGGCGRVCFHLLWSSDIGSPGIRAIGHHLGLRTSQWTPTFMLACSPTELNPHFLASSAFGGRPGDFLASIIGSAISCQFRSTSLYVTATHIYSCPHLSVYIYFSYVHLHSNFSEDFFFYFLTASYMPISVSVYVIWAHCFSEEPKYTPFDIHPLTVPVWQNASMSVKRRLLHPSSCPLT